MAMSSIGDKMEATMSEKGQIATRRCLNSPVRLIKKKEEGIGEGEESSESNVELIP